VEFIHAAGAVSAAPPPRTSPPAAVAPRATARPVPVRREAMPETGARPVDPVTAPTPNPEVASSAADARELSTSPVSANIGGTAGAPTRAAAFAGAALLLLAAAWGRRRLLRRRRQA
jgi:hypothetical protein